MFLTALVAAAAAATSFNVPATLGSDLKEAKQKTNVPILLPQTIRSGSEKLYGHALDGASTRAGRYAFTLGTKKHCHDAACTAATFGGIRASGTIGGTRVRLAEGREGRYHSGEERRIEWHERGTIYVLYYAESTGKKDLIRLANSAIRKGPR